MALFSDKTKDEVARMAANAKSQLAKAKEKAEEAIETVVTAGETVGTAFGLAYARGRMTDLADEKSFTLMGIDPDLGLGLGLHVMGFVVDKKWSSHAHAIANGALCSFAVHEGLKFGTEDRAEAGEGPPHRVLSAGAPAGASPFSPGFAQRVAQAGRAA